MLQNLTPTQLFWIFLAVNVTFIGLYLLLRNSPSKVINDIKCSVKRILRRWSWAWLLLVGLALYPVQHHFQIKRAAEQAAQGANTTSEIADVAAATASKLVDPDQVFSKMSLACGVFALENLLTWGAICMVFSVLANWAKGEYNELDAMDTLPSTPDFKRSFLAIANPFHRLLIYAIFFTIEAFMAQAAIEHAFRIQ